MQYSKHLFLTLGQKGPGVSLLASHDVYKLVASCCRSATHGVSWHIATRVEIVWEAQDNCTITGAPMWLLIELVAC